MGFKELYGGGLFLRESNNSLIFVRSNYRVGPSLRGNLTIVGRFWMVGGSDF
jgi:hypothetical protein